jgi:hypothetical protein
MGVGSTDSGISSNSCYGSSVYSSKAASGNTIGSSVLACSYGVAFSSSRAITVGSTVSSTNGDGTGVSPNSGIDSDFSTSGAAAGTSGKSCEGSVFCSSGAVDDEATGTIGCSVVACSYRVAFSSSVAIAVGSTVSSTYGGDTGASPDSRFVSDFSTAGAAGTHSFGSVASGSCGAATGTSATSCDGSIFSSSGAAGDFSTGTIGSSVVA